MSKSEGHLTFETLLGGLLLTSFLWPQGVTAPTPYPYFITAGLIGLLGALLFWWLRPVFSFGLPSLCLSGLLVWGSASTLQSVDVHLSLVFVAHLALGLISFILGCCCRSSGGWRLIVLILVVGVLVNSILGFGEMLRGGQLKANFTNPDCYSVLPLGLFFLCLGLYHAERRGQTLMAVGGAACMVIVLALTSCRASFLGLVVGLALLSWMAVSAKELRPVIKAGVWVPLLGVSLLLALGQVSKVTEKWQRLLTNQDLGNVKSRLDVFVYGPGVAFEKPLFGYGPGTFHLAYQRERPEPRIDEEFMNVAHNDFVQVWVDLGFPGLLLFLGFCLSLVWIVLKKDPLDPERAGAACAWLALVVYLNLNFALPVAACSTWLFAFGGLLAARTGRPTRPGPAARIGVTVLLIGASLWLLQFGNAGRAVQEVRHRADRLATDLEWAKAYQMLEPALSLQPRNKELLVERSRLALRLGLLLDSQDWISRAVAPLQEAHRLSPLDIEIVARLARALERSGELLEGEKIWRRGLEIAPHNWRLQRDLVRNLLLQGRTEQAQANMKTLGPNRFPTAYGELLALLELAEPGRGQSEFGQLLSEQEPEVTRKVTLGLLQATSSLQQRKARRAFLEAYLERYPEDLCLRLDFLETSEGRGSDYEDALLEIALANTDDDETRPCLNRALRLWAGRKLNRKAQLDNVLELLNQRLRDQPQQIEIRIMTSRAYMALEERAAARAVLREGLDFDPKGALHGALGDVFLEGGHLETAAGYYEEALRRNPRADSWRQRLESIQESLLE